MGGYALFIEGGRLVYAYNHVGNLVHLLSDREVPVGDITVAFEFTRTGPMIGDGRLLIAGEPGGEVCFAKTLSHLSLAPLLIGRATMPPWSAP
jgi:hypothetical protein